MGVLRQKAIEEKRAWEEKARADAEAERIKRTSEFTRGWKRCFDTDPESVEWVEENGWGGGYILIEKEGYTFAAFADDVFFLKTPEKADKEPREWPRVHCAADILKYYPEEPEVKESHQNTKKCRFDKKSLIRCEDGKKGLFQWLKEKTGVM